MNTIIQLIIENSATYFSFIPEGFLSFSIMIQLLYLSNLKKKSKNSIVLPFNRNVSIQTFCVLMITLLICLLLLNMNLSFSGFSFINNRSTYALKMFLIFAALLSLGTVSQSFFLEKLVVYEFYSLYLISILGSMLMLSASDFLSFYVSMEIQAFALYCMAALKKDSIFPCQSSLKYFIFSSVMTALFLLALSLLYGMTGTMSYKDLHCLFVFSSGYEYDIFFEFSIFSCLILFLTFVLFKIAGYPFHIWAIDVYEGIPISVTIILSFLIPITFLNFLVKISFIFGTFFQQIQFFILIFGIFSVYIGASLAVQQSRLKRFIICSGLSQVGIPITLLGCNTYVALELVYFYLFFYVLSTIALWNIYVFLYEFFGTDRNNTEYKTGTPLHIHDLVGSFYFNKIWVAFLIILFFSIAGIPPFAGFVIKVLFVTEAIKSTNIIVSISLLFTSAISTFYYTKLVKLASFDINNQPKRKFLFLSQDFTTILIYNLFSLILIIFILTFAFFSAETILVFIKNFYIHDIYNLK